MSQALRKRLYFQPFITLNKEVGDRLVQHRWLANNFVDEDDCNDLLCTIVSLWITVQGYASFPNGWKITSVPKRTLLRDYKKSSSL